MKQISITTLFFILLVPVLIGMGVLLFLLSSNRSATAHQPAGEPAQEVIRPPLSATLKEIVGTVLTRLPQQKDFSPANENAYIYVDAQVKTMAQSRVRLDLSNGSIVRLGENTIFTLVDQSATPQGIFYKIRLTLGDLWVILTGGELQVETPSGVAAVRGSYLSVSYHPENNVSRVTCLEGNCSLQNDAGKVDFVAGQSAYVHHSEVPPVVERMEQEDVVEWLLNNPEAVLVMTPFAETRQALPTLTAGPSLTPPFTFTPGPSPTPTATRTFTPSPTQTASPTPTVTTSVTASITPTETITPTPTITPTSTMTDTPAPTATRTKTLPPTKSFTPSKTNTPVTYTATPSKTFTPSLTYTPVTNTATPTQTATKTFTPSATKSFTPTATKTFTPTVTRTFTRTNTPVTPVATTALAPCPSVTQIPVAECVALVKLYNQTNGSGWTNKTGWLANNTPCSWYGVTCTSGHISSLVLGNNALTGTLPTEMGNLTYLVTLDLSNNQISGGIPSWIGSLTLLNSLSLYRNPLGGSIPTTIGNLDELEHLYLSQANLTGAIPWEIGNMAKLMYIDLSLNQLTGSIPSQLGSVTTLVSLNLSDNQITGALPSTIGNLTNLQTLKVAVNKMSGAIPASIMNLTNLNTIRVGGGTNTLDADTTDSTVRNWLTSKDPNWTSASWQ